MSDLIIHQKLAACVNTLSSDSKYLWNEVMSTEKEWIVLAKTLPDKIDAFEQCVIQNHPYEIPLIGCWSMEVNENYFNWVEATLNEKTKD